MFAALSALGSVAALVLMYHWKYLITLGLQERSGCVANDIMSVRVTDSGTVSRPAVC